MEKKEDRGSAHQGNRSANSATTSGVASEGSVKGSEGSSGHGRDEKDKHSKSNKIPTGQQFLEMCKRGEWLRVDNALRTTPKGQLDLNYKDKETGITPLMQAVKENKLVVVEKLLESGADVNETSEDGRTALHFAANYASAEILKLLILKGANPDAPAGPGSQLPLHIACARIPGEAGVVNVLTKAALEEPRMFKDGDGSIPLFVAAECGNITAVKELLAEQPDTQLTWQREDNGDGAIHIAARRRDMDMLRTLIEHHCPIDLQNKDGHSALHLAAWNNDDAMVRYLHSNKANHQLTDKFDRAPLHIAAERGHAAVADLLMEKFKATVNSRTKDGSTLMHIASQFGHPDAALAFLKKGVPLRMPDKNGAICLHAAATKGHVAVVKALLQKGAPVDALTKQKLTALHLAVENRKPDVVMTLLGFGAEVDLKGGPGGETPLHIAARTRHGEKCAEMLLKCGAGVNVQRENGETALHIAARHGQLLVVKALLEEGADIFHQDKSGETALHIAVRHCQSKVAKEILEYVERTKSKIDASMLVNTQNAEGETAMHYAAEINKKMLHEEFEDIDMMKCLLKYNGDINTTSKMTQETPMHYLARQGNADVLTEMVHLVNHAELQVAFNKQNKMGQSALLLASQQGHTDLVKILLENHARVDVFDEYGMAALHFAAESGHEKVADMLLDNRAFVNAKTKQGLTPLHLAAQNGYNQLAKSLISKHNAALDVLTLQRRTPLHSAAASGEKEVAATLIKFGADASARDANGQTPLHLAAENDHPEVVKLFLNHRPDLVCSADMDGMTCAHIAAVKGSHAVIRELMRFDKDVILTAKNKTNGSTALHLAAQGGHTELVNALIRAGADPLSENGDGDTVVHLAAKYGHMEIIDGLKNDEMLKKYSQKTGLTALHVAAQCGQIDIVRELLTKVPATCKSEPPSTVEGVAEYGMTPLHMAAQSGHEGLVRMLLNCPGVQVDSATEVNGAIPLHLAAQFGHTNVASLLLSKSTAQLHIKDNRGRTPLHMSATNGHYDICALLLGQGSDINSGDMNGWTPLHCASKAGYLRVVKLLVESGANTTFADETGKIPICYAAAANHFDVLSYLMTKDHGTDSLMEDTKFVFDLMVCGKVVNNRCIQEFVLLSEAPVDTAAKMAHKFSQLAIKEKERARDLLLAAAYCESMATDLLAIAASSCGAQILLKSRDNRELHFLDVLIECEQKEVVSHPSVQKYLSDVWVGSMRWATWKIILLFLSMLFFPFVWVYFSLPVKHKFSKVPIIKFMCYLVSHMYLMVLFCIEAVSPIYPTYTASSLTLIPHWNEWLLLAWISGLLVSELTNPGDRAGLGWLKVVVLGICSLAVMAHFLCIFFAEQERLMTLYVRNQLFALALLLCFVQLLDFLSFHHLFGPWAIIIRDLMKDLIRFLVILLIFMVGFTLDLAACYQPVYRPPPVDPTLGDGDGDAVSSTLSPIDTFEFLFFALFGLVDPDTLPALSHSPLWVAYLIKGVYGTYMMVTLIVLINLLIAMMSDTYQRIQQQSDTEWKFGRAKLIRNMNKTAGTPSPLNLFTVPIVFSMTKYKQSKRRKKKEGEEGAGEEEEMEEMTKEESLDMGSRSNSWLRTVIRRKRQISPAEGYKAMWLHVSEVVDWRLMVRRYRIMVGQGDMEQFGKDQEQDEKEGEE